MMSLLQRRAWHAAGAQLAHLASLLLLTVVAGLGIATAAVAIQAQRDETRSADLLLVLTPDLPPAALIDHSFDLYRRGYTVQIVLVGLGRAQATADLRARGVPETAFSPLAKADSLPAALSAARAINVQSLLVVSGPAEQLLSLKVAHDQGLRAYGSPTPAQPLELLDALRAAIGYWRYALFQV